MKRLISFFLVLIMCLSMAACASDSEKSEDKEDKKDKEKIEKEEPAEESEEYKAAKALLDDGKVTDAYIALYAIRDEDCAKALMEKFIVVSTVEESVNGSVTKLEYSDEGLKEKESIYYDGTLESSCVYSYEEGRCVKVALSFNGQGAKQYTYYEYDSDGLLTKMEMEYGGSVSETRYYYDGDGKCIKQVSGDSAGYEYVTELEYDKKGNLIKETTKEGKEVLSTVTYEVDGEGRVTEIITEYLRYGGSDVCKMTYNTDGKLAVQSFAAVDGEHYDMVFFYNQQHGGLTSVEKHYSDGSEEKITEYSGFEFYYAG